ncbi:MAG: LptA/OstA family protein [Acidaminococcaceae bacterium]|nr:LptA/OstA family protein [Acidaminococcaceae bacterium]
MRKLVYNLMLVTVLCVAFAGVASAESTISSNVLEYDFRTGEAVAKEHVTITRDDGSKIEAAHGSYNTKTEAGRLEGGVVANQPDGHATCNTLVLAAGGKQLSAIGNAVIKKQDKTLQAGQVDYDQARGYMETVGSWARLLLDDGSTLDAEHIDYTESSGIANAVGNVKIDSEARKLTGSGDKAIYDTKQEDGTLELIGNAKATQDGNSVAGNRLILRGASGKSASVSEGFGNVKLVYIPRPQPAAKTKDTTEITSRAMA